MANSANAPWLPPLHGHGKAADNAGPVPYESGPNGWFRDEQSVFQSSLAQIENAVLF